MISDELVRAVAQAITDEIIRQEGSTDGQIKLPDDMVLQFIDQNNIDMGAVARNAIKATAAAIRAQVLEEAAKVLDDVTAGHRRVSDVHSRNGYARGMELALYAAKTSENASAAIRAMKEPT